MLETWKQKIEVIKAEFAPSLLGCLVLGLTTREEELQRSCL
jgi:hypothetical protein